MFERRHPRNKHSLASVADYIDEFVDVVLEAFCCVVLGVGDGAGCGKDVVVEFVSKGIGVNWFCADWISRRGVATFFVHWVPIGGKEGFSGDA